LAGVIACGLLAACAPAALATHIGCGVTVTQDTTLDSDLVDCPGNGVLIAGTGVTLDLAGHLIDGTGGPYGVVTVGRTANVAVVGGRVRQFHNAVALGGGGPFLARDLEVSGSHDGILLVGANRTVVERVLAWGNDGSGINMPASHDVLVTDSVMVGNGAGMGAANATLSRIEQTLFEGNTFHGLRFAGLTDTVIIGNRVRSNGTFGMRLEEGSSGNLLSGNRVSDSGADGIGLAEDSGSNRLERNRSVRNGGDGFDLAGAGTTLVRNRADRNAGLGFDAPLGVALDVRNVARHNMDPRQCVGVDCGLQVEHVARLDAVVGEGIW
jgi:parallel beta-helix repeat protein